MSNYYNAMITDYFNMQPTQVEGVHTRGVDYYKRILYNRLFSCFEFTLPKEWKINLFRLYLMKYGSLAVIYTKEYGWIFNTYSVKKLDLYYNPSEILCVNPSLSEEKTGVIGINSHLVHCFDDFFGFDDIITRFATDLAQCDKSMEINLMNCSVGLVCAVENKKEAEELKKAYASATQGEPCIYVSKSLESENQFRPLVNNTTFNADKIAELRRNILNDFYSTIGIRNTNYEKKERLVSQEVNENNDETRSIISVVFDNITEDFEAINKMSGLNLSVKLRYNYNEEGGAEDCETI